ncbi:MAG: serine/threonine protein kinase [Acidobacteriia bacterium]|nr:serine/threonine protein kinase [Terriglobia bacterium]
MTYLPDRTLDHLRQVAELPDLSGTRYEMEGELGRGGMGVVYRARDTLLGRSVALKVTEDGGAEARLIARLEHPGIVPVYDAGALPDGRRYYAMKLVDGLRLDRFLEREPALPGRLRVFEKVCEAVAFAHSRGVVHRDLKPQNIMVGAFGEALVMDWGVPGAVAGTPRYMAPEQAAGSADARSDVFSLGALLEDVMRPESPRPLAAIARKARAANPEERYASVRLLAADAARFMDGLAVTAYRETPWERLVRFARGNRTLLLLLAAYLAMRLLLFAIR